MSSISNFLGKFKTGEFARPNRFDVLISFPTALTVDYKDIVYRCESAELPARTLATTEQRIYGPIEKHPYLTTFNDIDLTFIVDNALKQRAIFDKWMDYVNPSESYDFKYKGDYAGTINIKQYNDQNIVIYEVDLLDAYPVSIGQLALDWGSDGYHKLNVTFAYTKWVKKVAAVY